MIRIVLALAGLALAAPTSAWAAENVKAPAAKAKAPARKAPAAKAKAPARKAAAKKKPKAPAAPEPAAVVEEDPGLSEAATRVVDWVDITRDNGKLPYAIIDKQAATVMLFDAKGKPLGKAPVLIGIAVGDDATAGVGAKSLSALGPAEKTTPAGRFVAKYGLAFGRQRVLWVDYATSVALHPIPTVTKANRKEKRPQRMASKTSEDNRITFGCINVPNTFYAKSVEPLFRKRGGVVYVMPDTKSLEEVFPRIRVQPFLTGGRGASSR